MVNKVTRVPKADITIHGAVLSVAVPCLRSSPRLGVGAGRPNPRKSRAVIAVMADTTVKGINVTKVDNTFGRI